MLPRTGTITVHSQKPHQLVCVPHLSDIKVNFKAPSQIFKLGRIVEIVLLGNER